MTLFFFLVSLCWSSTHPIGTLVTIRYSIKRLPDTRGTGRCGFYKYYLILLKAFLHSSFQVLGYFLLNSWKIGSHVVVSWVMNQAIYFNLPKNPLTLFFILGEGIDWMTFTLLASTFIHMSLTTNPINFLDLTPSDHFIGLSLILYFLNLSNNFLKTWRWISSFLDLAIILSTHTPISMCIISWNRVTISL